MKRIIAFLLVWVALIAGAETYKPVQKGEKWGIQNSVGEWTVKPKYFEIRPFGDNFFVRITARNDRRDKWALMSKNADILLPELWGILPFGENFFVKTKKAKDTYDERWALIDKDANILQSELRGSYNSKKPFAEIDGDKAIVTVWNNKYNTWKKGAIDSKGAILIPFEYEGMKLWGDKYVVREKYNGGYGLLNENFEKILPCKYKAIEKTAIPDVVYTGNEYVSLLTGESKTFKKGSVSCDNNGCYQITVAYGGTYKRLIPGTRAQYITVTEPSGEFRMYYKDGHFYDRENQIPKTPAVDPKRPPILNLVAGSLRFIDQTGNQAIDADETCKIVFKVSNTGKGAGRGCVARVRTTARGITVADQKLPAIAAGQTLSVEVPVTASASLADGKADFNISVYEPNGFGCDPTTLTVATNAFVAPYLQITDYAVNSAAGTTITKRVPFDMQLLLQNVRHGNADGVKVTVKVPENVFVTEGETELSIASMPGGSQRLLNYSLIVNNNYTQTTIPVRIDIEEKYGRYAESKTVTLSLNQTLSGNRLVIDEVKSAPRGEIELAKISGKETPADVDQNIPKGRTNNENTLCVIIVNENYRRESNVEYALNDGEVFRRYCIETFGIPEKNIRFYGDATLNDMRAALGWLSRAVAACGSSSSVIFYYAGHGIPDEATRSAYLLPTDGYGSDVETGYALKTLYATLGKLSAEKVTVFLDACFSGAQRDGKMMASARGVAIKSKPESLQGNTVVLTAASDDETAYPYREKRHGLFTYYLLKKWQETQGSATLGELADYLRSEVVKESVLSNSKSQTPTVSCSPALTGTWETWKLK